MPYGVSQAGRRQLLPECPGEGDDHRRERWGDQPYHPYVAGEVWDDTAVEQEAVRSCCDTLRAREPSRDGARGGGDRERSPSAVQRSSRDIRCPASRAARIVSSSGMTGSYPERAMLAHARACGRVPSASVTHAVAAMAPAAPHSAWQPPTSAAQRHRRTRRQVREQRRPPCRCRRRPNGHSSIADSLPAIPTSRQSTKRSRSGDSYERTGTERG